MIVHFDRRCLEHGAPPGFPERPQRLVAILDAWSGDARFDLREADAAEDGGDALDAVRALHETSYVERFRAAVERGDGILDSADNPISGASFEAALAASRTAIAALGGVLAGAGEAFAAVRPPGHHAERDRAMGFCFFNHAAVVAESALRRHGLERVAIIDIDVHHGNGTQHLFEDRADVFYASLHQYPFYPGTGAEQETGLGVGRGTTLNCPLPAGSGDEAWLAALELRIIPAVARFRPDLVVVSAGFDAWREDPLGGLDVSREAFAQAGRQLRQLAEELCEGRLLSVLEGGYDVVALPALAAAFLAGEV